MLYNILLSIGIITFLISAFILKKSLSFLKESDRAVGKVIEIQKVDGTDGVTYKPIFKFTTRLNQEIIYEYPFSSSPSTWNLTDEATLAYDPNNPDKVKILTYFGAFGWSVILMAIAMPLIVIGGGYHLSRYIL